MRIKKYFVSLFSAVFIFSSVFNSYNVANYSYAAFLPAAVGVWEVIQWVLLSVGVTVLGYEITSDIVELGSNEPYVEAFQRSMNDFRSGLGDDVLNRSKASLTEQSVTLERETWSDLSSWSKSLFNDLPTATINTNGIKINLSTAQDMYNFEYELSKINTSQGQLANHNKFLNDALASDTPITLLYAYRIGTFHDIAYYIWCYSDDKSVIDPTVSRDDYTVTVYNNGNNFHWYGFEQRSDGYALYFDGYDYINFSSNIKLTIPDLGVEFVKPIVGNTISLDAKISIYPAYRDQVLEDNLDIVAPGTSVKDGTLTGDVVLPFPADIDDVLQGVKDGILDIPDVLEDANVFPVPKDDTQAIEDALSKVGTTAPPIDKFALSLTEFFPFCLPFDFVDFISCFEASPVAPEITFPMPIGYENGEVIYHEFTFSLAQFDDVASWVRTFELLAFIIGLTMITRNMFIRG